MYFFQYRSSSQTAIMFIRLRFYAVHKYNGRNSTRKKVILLFRRICCLGPPPVKPSFSVLCLGVGGSGKSTLLAKVSGESTNEIEPTIGFSIKALMFSDCFVDVKELGGGDNVRPYWDRYYGGAQGVIFVVDSSCDAKTMETTIEEFHNALDNDELEGLPLFVLANFQDVPGARSANDIRELLKLGEQNRQWVLHSCTASDKSSIQSGFEKFNKLLLAPHNAGATGEFAQI